MTLSKQKKEFLRGVKVDWTCESQGGVFNLEQVKLKHCFLFLKNLWDSLCYVIISGKKAHSVKFFFFFHFKSCWVKMPGRQILQAGFLNVVVSRMLSGEAMVKFYFFRLDIFLCRVHWSHICAETIKDLNASAS